MKKRFGKLASLFAALMLCGGAVGLTTAAADDVVLEYSWVSETDSSKTGSKTATNFEDGWNDVMRKCNDGNIVTVTLCKDWVAPNGNFTDDFFNGPGFNWDTIYVNDNADLILDLNGHTIDRQLDRSKYNGEVIYVDEGANLTIKNGTIKGGHSSNGSGGIHINEANVTLENVKITECMVVDDDGLAVYLDEGSLTMTDCTIEGNELNDGSGVQCYGTIHAADAKKVEIRNTSFSGDNFLDYGGIIHCDDVETVIIENCTFKDSAVDNNGGAIWLGEIDNAKILDCSFENCSAEGQGGAFWGSDVQNFTMQNISFRNCSADEGGAIYLEDSVNPVIENCSFTQCTVDSYGGAVYLYDNPGLQVNDCTFTDNIAGSQGGAVYTDSLQEIDDLQNIFLFNRCTFRGNGAGGDGGAYYINGGAFNASYVTLTDCAFHNNVSGARGGALYQESSNEVTLRNCSITGNQSKKQGGGIFSEGEFDQAIKMYLTLTGNVVIKDNTGTDGRVDNLYTDSRNTLYIAELTSAPRSIGLRDDGNGYSLGYILDHSFLEALFSDNPKLAVYSEKSDKIYRFYMPEIEDVDYFDISASDSIIAPATGKPGQTIAVSAEERIGAEIFSRWESSSVTFADPTAVSTTFVMPADNVFLSAVYELDLSKPIASHVSGSYNAYFDLKLESPAGLDIYYGLGKNADCSKLYDGPLDLSTVVSVVETCEDGLLREVCYVYAQCVYAEDAKSDVLALRFEFGEGWEPTPLPEDAVIPEDVLADVNIKDITITLPDGDTTLIAPVEGGSTVVEAAAEATTEEEPVAEEPVAEEPVEEEPVEEEPAEETPAEEESSEHTGAMFSSGTMLLVLAALCGAAAIAAYVIRAKKKAK